jgi:hypothetical protein
MIVRVRAVRAIGTWSQIVGFLGACIGFRAQWISNSLPELDEQTFIPFVGEVFTYKLMGAEWLFGLILFLVGFAGFAVCWGLERRGRQPGANDSR